MKQIKILFMSLFLISSLSITSCKDSTFSQFKALGSTHTVIQYGYDGKIINQWISTGSVSNSTNSDGWYFEDAQTHKLIEVTGCIVIIQN